MERPASVEGRSRSTLAMFTHRRLNELYAVAAAAAVGFFAGKQFHSTARIAENGTGLPAVKVELPAPHTGNGLERNKDKAAESCEGRCFELLAQPSTPFRNHELIVAIEKLASRDPLRAIELARSEANPQFRRQLLESAFCGWGRVDADAAAEWIFSQPKNSIDVTAAVAATLKGAAENPDAAVSVARRLIQRDPDDARGFGDALIYALGENGNFQRAADFAASGSDNSRAEWLASAYGNWANYQPQAAAQSAMQLENADMRCAAIDAVIPAWAQTDPKDLAEFARNYLPEGDQKTRALSDALISWAASNTADAANWINSIGPVPELDQGEAAIATQQNVMKQPDVALQWAEVISDLNLRSRTITAIVETWALSDRAAAMSFLETSTDVLPEDRANLLSLMNPPAD